MEVYSRCSKCKEEKSSVDFYRKADGSTQTYCKKCILEVQIQRSRERKIKIIGILGSKCIDCGLSYPEIPSCVFDVHHLDPLMKGVETSILRTMNEQKMITELSSCVLLCSNCHRKRHINERRSLHKKNRKCVVCGEEVKKIGSARCPECHKRHRSEVFKERKQEQKHCSCGKVICHNSKACKHCTPHKKKVEWPPYEQLIEDVKTVGYCATGRKYGVSDNAVRKWIKFYKERNTDGQT